MRWMMFLMFAACTSTPTPTGAVCPDPDPGTPSWDDFGEAFMSKYCTMCHDSHLTRSQRNGAPIYHDFDTLLGVVMLCDPKTKTAIHIDEYAGWGPDAKNSFMPGARCPSVPGGSLDQSCAQPTGDERTRLALWVACECQRPHTVP